MRSQAVLAFRAIVMLSVLVLIPLIAVSGPEMLQFLEGLLSRGPRQPDITAQTSAGSMLGSQDPGARVGPWRPASVPPSATRPPGRVVNGSVESRWAPLPGRNPQEGIGAADSPPFPQPSAPRFASISPPHDLPGQAAAVGIPLNPMAPSVDPKLSSRPVGSGVVAASHSAPMAPANPHQSPPTGNPREGKFTASPDTGRTDLAQDSRFLSILRRLRELGATYYVLETWGEGGSLLRFYCRMAVASNPACNRYFEATDADPLVAMTKVLSEVESWRAARP